MYIYLTSVIMLQNSGITEDKHRIIVLNIHTNLNKNPYNFIRICVSVNHTMLYILHAKRIKYC